MIIIDYKTDRVAKNKIEEKAKAYYNQLLFYSYVLSKLFMGKKIQIRLIFTEHPEDTVINNITGKELDQLQQSLIQFIEKTMTGEYKPNLNHCSKTSK